MRAPPAAPDSVELRKVTATEDPSTFTGAAAKAKGVNCIGRGYLYVDVVPEGESPNSTPELTLLAWSDQAQRFVRLPQAGYTVTPYTGGGALAAGTAYRVRFDVYEQIVLPIVSGGTINASIAIAISSAGFSDIAR